MGKDGKIYRVAVRENRIRCEDKAVQKDLLRCFSQALRETGLDESTRLNILRNQIILSAPL